MLRLARNKDMPENQIDTYKKFLIAFIVIAGLGFMDSSYLAIEHFLGSVPPCSIVEGCEVVTTSAYSVIGPIPVALLGSLYYLAVIVLSLFAIDRRSMVALRLASKITWVGLLASAYFVFIQLFVLHAICIYCMGSALGSTILFILGMIVLKRTRELNELKVKSL
jgi:uncharacterized membrane protein